MMMARTDALVLTGLSVGYGARIVVPALDMAAIAPGTVVSLIGPNAAGKTTLLRALAGLHPAQGSVRLGDRELTTLDLADHARLVTYMPQSLPLRVALTVLESVVGALQASSVDGASLNERQIVDRALDVIERVGIGHLAMIGLDRLSGGQRQLASLAQALVRSPRVLLLDEPISALDLHYQVRVMKLLRQIAHEQTMIVVMVLHDLSIAARWSDRIVMLSNGQVKADGPPHIALSPELLAKVYHVRADVMNSYGTIKVDILDILPLGQTRKDGDNVGTV